MNNCSGQYAEDNDSNRRQHFSMPFRQYSIDREMHGRVVHYLLSKMHAKIFLAISKCYGIIGARQ